MAVSVPAVAIDDDYRPITEPVRILTRDISETGLGLVFTHRITAGLLAIELPAATGPIQVVIEVMRCQRVGPFYDVGGRFVARLE